MKGRKVLHLIETNGPGGAETVMSELIGRSDRSTYEALGVFPSTDGWLGRVVPQEDARPVAPSAQVSSRPIDPRYLWKLRRLFARERPDIIHAHSFDAAFYASLAVRGTRTKLVATFHGATDCERTGWRNQVKWRALRRADSLICVSESLCAVARNSSGLGSSIEVIYNGIDTQVFHPQRNGQLRKQLRMPFSTLLIGAVGNVRRCKDYDVLIRAVAMLKARSVSVHLVIAGDTTGPMARALEQLTESMDVVDMVTFLGFVDDVPTFLNGIDLFVLSSGSEGFSLSTAQALATALPVVVTRSGGPEEIVEHGVSGCLVEPGSPENLASALEDLAFDEPRRSRLALAARSRVVQAFSIEKMVQRYADCYARVLDHR